MIFTNPRQYNSYAQTNRTNNAPIAPNRMMQYVAPTPPPPQSRQNITPENATPPKSKPMVWGQPTWYFFHTLAEKVKEDQFPQIRLELLNIINMICNNLPCPICTEHAKQFMNGVNFNTIVTKNDLKALLFRFHNEVNKRKGYPEFNQSLLDEKYSKAITSNIIHNFIGVYENRTRGFKQLADELHRSRIITILKSWLLQHITAFDS